MTNPLYPWIIRQIEDGLSSSEIAHNYLADPICGYMPDKTLRNRIGEVRTVMNALEELNYTPSKETSLIEQTQKENKLEVALKSYAIQTEWDLRKYLKYEDEEKYRCVRFMCRPSQNATNPWFIVQGTFEERQTFPALDKVGIPLSTTHDIQKTQSNAALVLSDWHVPFHDERCLQIAIQVARDLQPTHIVLNGDLLDATDLSKWPADIEHRNRLNNANVIVAMLIAQLRDVCLLSKIVYLEGNHEARLQKELLKSVAAAVGLKRVDDLDGHDALSIPNLLCLDDRDVEWVPYKDKGFWLHDKLKFHHGEELNVSKMVKDRSYSLAMGHGHRFELLYKANEYIKGQLDSFVAMFGCMCLLDGSVPAVKSTMNWQQGFGVIYYDGEYSCPVPVHIHEGRALFNGKIYST